MHPIFVLIAILVAICIIFLVKYLIKSNFKKTHPETYCEAYDYTEDAVLTVLHKVFVNRWVYDRKLLITMHYSTKSCVIDPKRPPRHEMIRTEYWTDEKKKDVHLDGYRVVRGMHDSLLWLGVPMYMKVENAKFFQVPDTKTDGRFDYPQDTGETLHDYASSNATEKFITAMSKTALSNMDTHTIIMIAILAAGAIIGMKIFGVF